MTTPKIKIAVVTGSRADYGLLFCPMKAIQAHPLFELQIIATGMHLASDFGNTYKNIEADGFEITYKVDSLLAGDSESSIIKSLAIGTMGFADLFQHSKPDLLMVLGDRYEIFAAVQAALIARVPVAHIAGGDTTEGAFDESLRHSISKMSHLHFTTNEIASARVKQLGENPNHIFTVGSPAIDLINQTDILDRDELQTRIKFKFRTKNLLITYHPTTLEINNTQSELECVFSALEVLDQDTGLIFTKSNADTAGRSFNAHVEQFVATHPNATLISSSGQQNYYSLLNHVDAVVGNSSSGLYEAPSFITPTVNIGDRQKGRLRAASVIDCGMSKSSIISAIRQALSMRCEDTINPYGDGNATKQIMYVLEQYADKNKLRQLLKKHFFDNPR